VIEMWLNVRKLRVEEPIFVVVGTTVDEKVLGCHAALLASGDKNNDRLRW
jgi:hypothetical protein